MENDMSDVKRYYLEYTAEHPSGGPQLYDADPREDNNGYWVDYDDHEEIVQSLQAENEILNLDIKELKAKYESALRGLRMRNSELNAENDRLKATIEDRSMNEHDEIGAADSYWEIAEVLNVPEGASVIEFAAHLVSDEYVNKLKADAVREFKKDSLTRCGLSAAVVQLAKGEYVHRTWIDFCDAYANELERGDV